MSDDPIVYERDNHVCYRASAVGGCLVSMAAARQGAHPKPPPPDMLAIFQAGRDAEDQFVTIFPSAVSDRQMEVRLPVTSRIQVVGHLDGRHGNRLAEIKSQSDAEYEAWTPAHWTSDPLWVRYSWQISCYMLALDREASVFRVRRSNVEDFAVQVVEKPFWTLDDIRERVLDVEALAATDVLLCDRPSYPCPYHYLHIEGEMVDDPRLTAAITDYLSASEDVKWGNKIKDEARKVFEEFTTEHPKVILPNGTRLSRSEYDRKETVVPARHEVRYTVTPPKE